MTIFRTVTAVVVVLSLCTSAAPGVTGVPWVGWITAGSGEETSLFVLPDGEGPPLTEATLFGGQVVVVIALGLVDEQGYPVSSFPRKDIWLDTESGNVFNCMILVVPLKMCLAIPEPQTASKSGDWKRLI